MNNPLNRSFDALPDLRGLRRTTAAGLRCSDIAASRCLRKALAILSANGIPEALDSVIASNKQLQSARITAQVGLAALRLTDRTQTRADGAREEVATLVRTYGDSLHTGMIRQTK